MAEGRVDVIVGLQRGDEGKGRITDLKASEGEYDIVARFNGGDNAGHQIVLPDGTERDMHILPSGILNENLVNIIGSGTYVNPVRLIEEAEVAQSYGFEVSPHNLIVSSQAHIIFPSHISEDEIREAGKGSQGSTKRGIAFAGRDKTLREGKRCELLDKDLEGLIELERPKLLAHEAIRAKLELEPLDVDLKIEEFSRASRRVGEFVTDTVYYLGSRLRGPNPPRILAEAAQASQLDLDHGMYPYVTSSNTIAPAAGVGLGIPSHYIKDVYGVMKAMPSHVGSGPFVTEVIDPELLDQMHGDRTAVDGERGKTTGRDRRLGVLDLPAIRRAIWLNSDPEHFSLIITKLDWIPRYGKQVMLCTDYTRKGKPYPIGPDAGYKLDQCEPHYVTLPTWSEDIQDARQIDDLPEEAQTYLTTIEKHLGYEAAMVGVGPRRDQIIVR